jgi:hypothetical protein
MVLLVTLMDILLLINEQRTLEIAESNEELVHLLSLGKNTKMIRFFLYYEEVKSYWTTD